MSYAVEIVNASGHSDRTYNVFSAPVTLGPHTDGTPQTVVWHRTPVLGQDQSELFVHDNSFYALVATKRNNQISTRETKKVTIGSHMHNGSILLLNKATTFNTYNADDIDTPDPNQFIIATNQSLPEGSRCNVPGASNSNYVVGVARGKENDSGVLRPAPVCVVTLKPRHTYTFEVNRALYIKATGFAAGTVQAAPTDDDDQAVRVQFQGQMRRAVVTENTTGNFTVTYSRDD